MSRLLASTFLLCLAASACAQLDRRSRDEPEMFVEAGGRSGTCDVMMFSPDGKFLYAGGDDKVVRVWPVGPNGIETGRMRTLRWPAWREQRGGIKTIALPANPTDRRVLVGGFGLKNGLVVLLDPEGEILATNEIDGQKLPAATVMASTFAPDGKSAVYGSADGRLWWWDFGKSNREIGRHTPVEGKPYNRPRLIRFLDEDTFISVAESGQVLTGKRQEDRWLIETRISIGDMLRNTVTAAGKDPPKGEFTVYRASMSGNGKWLACALRPNYALVASLETGESKFVWDDIGFRSLALDADGRMAIAAGGLNKQTNFYLDTSDKIQVCNPDRLAKDAEIKHPGRAEALAWNPNGLLAVAGGDNHEITLHNLKPPVKEAAGPFQVVRGKGRGIWDVRVGKDGESILFRTQRNPAATDPNDRGIGPWHAFDYAIGKQCEPKTAVPVRTTADGWKVEPSDKNPMVWYAVHQSGTRRELTLEPDRDEQPRCYCFVPAKGKKPTRLLVGHYYGFSIFELTPEGAVRTTLATGQAGDVHSIATDADGTWCITGGADQTIAGWSLADSPSGPFGAALELKDGRLFVTAVDLGGPAWEMGLSKGDEIVLAVPGKEILYGRAGRYQATTLPADTGNARAAFNALSEPTPGREYYLGWKRAGSIDVLEGLTTLRRRPLWRLFPGFESNERFEHWVAWMWKGGHYATSTSGDFLVGWQLNDPDTITQRRPEFFLANRFKGVLNKKLAVLRLMQTRDLPGALTELTGDNPQPPQFGKMEPAPVRLEVTGDAVDKNGLNVDIRVAARGKNPDLLPERVEIWVNDHRVKQWKAGGKTVAAKETIPAAAFRRGDNEVTVVTFNSAGGRGEVRRTVKYDREERRPRLLGLMVGINDYSQTAKNSDGTREFGNLNSAGTDAKTLGDLWKTHVGAGKLYAEDRLIVAIDPKSHQKEILSALDALAKEATPDDLIVTFLAGHGDFVAKSGATKGADDKVFIFCCPDYNRKDWEKTGLSGDVLFDRLADCKARKLVLIDACHSGGAASENVVRHLVPEGHGPIVIAACDQKELSFEHPKFGHGLFTTAVLEALGEKLDAADRSKDGKLDPQELFDYIRGRMPALLKEAGKPDRMQNPQAFPPDLGRFPIAGKK